MPRKGYKAITVKVETFQRFRRKIMEARKVDPEMENSEFLVMLLDRYKKSR